MLEDMGGGDARDLSAVLSSGEDGGGVAGAADGTSLAAIVAKSERAIGLR